MVVIISIVIIINVAIITRLIWGYVRKHIRHRRWLATIRKRQIMEEEARNEEALEKERNLSPPSAVNGSLPVGFVVYAHPSAVVVKSHVAPVPQPASRTWRTRKVPGVESVRGHCHSKRFNRLNLSGDILMRRGDTLFLCLFAMQVRSQLANRQFALYHSRKT